MTENELITFLTNDIPRKSGELKMGVSDDCAVFAGDGFDWLVTTDALLEGVHFDFRYTSDEELGRKSLNVNLSDIAAMGGKPKYYTINVGVPYQFSSERLKILYKGLKDVSDKYHVTLVGGDTCRSQSGLILSLAVIGRVEKNKAIFRSGAKAGDGIYITGTLGDSALGFKCLQKGLKNSLTTYFLKRHVDPMARLEDGEWLLETGCVTSMIDISDGLLADISHISSESKTGYMIDERLVPRSEGFERIASELDLNPSEVCLTGGEDYELLFTVAYDKISTFEKKIGKRKITRIGSITSNTDDNIVLGIDGEKLVFNRKGFDHFQDIV